jgi:hypothetical protein
MHEMPENKRFATGSGGECGHGEKGKMAEKGGEWASW